MRSRPKPQPRDRLPCEDRLFAGMPHSEVASDTFYALVRGGFHPLPRFRCKPSPILQTPPVRRTPRRSGRGMLSFSSPRAGRRAIFTRPLSSSPFGRGWNSRPGAMACIFPSSRWKAASMARSGWITPASPTSPRPAPPPAWISPRPAPPSPGPTCLASRERLLEGIGTRGRPGKHRSPGRFRSPPRRRLAPPLPFARATPPRLALPSSLVVFECQSPPPPESRFRAPGGRRPAGQRCRARPHPHPFRLHPPALAHQLSSRIARAQSP